MQKEKGSTLLPVSIIVAAVIIAGALIYNIGMRTSDSQDVNVDVSAQDDPAAVIAAVSEADHIRGSSGAPIIVITYTDYECPFCKTFHESMQRILSSFPDQVAWIYRQFPIENLHSKALTEAQAIECAAKLGGDEAFWAYSDEVFEVTPSNNGLDLAVLTDIVEEIGLDRALFERCLENEETLEAIAEDLEDAERLNSWVWQNGGRGIGTPFSVVVGQDGSSLFIIPGALPFEQIQLGIEEAIQAL